MSILTLLKKGLMFSALKRCTCILLMCVALYACDSSRSGSAGNTSPKAFLQRVKAVPYRVPEDSIQPLKKIKAGNPDVIPVGTPDVVETNLNVIAVSEKLTSTAFRLAALPTFTPGTDTFLLPRKIKLTPVVVPCGEFEVVQVKDAHTKDLNSGNFSSFSKLQGLKHGNVNDIVQDRRGNLWFCTDGGGATRYDGKYFTHFTEEAGLANNVVRCMMEDRQGNLWFGTDAGITCYNGKYFQNFKEKSGLPSIVVRDLVEDVHGNIWIASDSGVACYDGKILTLYGTRQGLCHDKVYTIMQDRVENLWFGTQNGVARFDGKSFVHIPTENALYAGMVRALLEDTEGNVWMGSEGGGLYRYDGKKLTRFTESDGVCGNIIAALLLDKNGDIWIGSEGRGISCYNRTSFTNFTDRHGLSSTAIISAFEDRKGNMWFGTYGGGVCRYDGKVLTHLTEKEGLSSSVARAIHQDKNGNIWYGTNGGGACVYNGKSIAWYNVKQGLTSHVVRSILEDNKGNFWLGTHGGGVCRMEMNPATGRGKTFFHYGEKQGLGHDIVRCMLQDSKGRIWFGTYGGGATCFDGENFTRFTTREGLSHNVILTIFEDRDHRIWFGTEGGGATCYDGKSFTHYNEKQGMSNKDVWAIVQDEYGIMWFGTGGGGISIFDGETFTHVTEKEGLSNNYVFSVLKDSQQNFWFGTRFGLNKLSGKNANRILSLSKKPVGFSKNEVFFKTFTHENGFLGIGCFGNSICEDKKGDIWIGTNDRVTVYHPQGDEPDSLPPHMELTGIDLFNENVNWPALFGKNQIKDTVLQLDNGVRVSDFDFSRVSKWYGLPRELSLSYHNNFLTFKYMGITQQQPALVKYTYKLEGLDENWSSLTSRTDATYGNLSHGSYVFKIKAMNGEGYWSKTYSFPFVIRPPWWKTLWFRILLTVSIVVSLYTFYRWRTASLRKRQKNLEETVINRTAEVVLQKEEAEKQRRIVERKQREITDSINYAKRIQEAILPPLKLIKEQLPQSFVLYKPKDIVAGDFYFFESTDTHLFLAAADCTGHGVPGAMVSMVCSNALERCVKEFGLTDPGKILDKTRELVIETFEKSVTEVRDGMDISLAVINKSTRKVSWAGANNALWICDRGASHIREIPSDKQSISKSYNSKPFTSHQVALTSGATLYLFTDGFVDQFGMPADEWSMADAVTLARPTFDSGKKFKSAKLKELLLSVQHENLDDQRILINQAFEAWKGPLEQIDDVCLIGIRL